LLDSECIVHGGVNTPEERYAELVDALVSTSDARRGADVDPSKKGFGSSGQLRIGGKIFAMLVRGRLVVKLPRQRVAALIATGEGEPFDTGSGRLMKEWLSLSQTATLDWLALAQEAMDFVAPR
jgi:hypothetical protein